MGLDITAYRKLTKVEGGKYDDDGDAVDANGESIQNATYRMYHNQHFPGRAQGLEEDAVYAYEDAEEVYSSGYGGYNRWRETLAKLAGYPLTEYVGSFNQRDKAHAAACWDGATGPFSELINFTDCDGVIGPVVAAKLLGDFREWDERAKSIQEDYFYERYANLMRGLEMAADGGALRFH